MPGPIHELSGEQYSVLLAVVNYGETHGATGMEILAAVEIGIVEDTLHNRDTATPSNPAVGWSQEEPEYGTVAERLDLNRSIPRVYNQLKERRGQYRTSGELAQAIQRSAYPLRYGEKEALAKTLIAELGANRAKPGQSFGPEPGRSSSPFMVTSTTADPPDRSHKIYVTGQHLGTKGSQFSGHRQAMRNLRNRHTAIKIR